MKKNRLFALLLIALMVGYAGWYVWDALANGTPWMEHLIQVALVEAFSGLILLRMGGVLVPHRDLSFYEAQYAGELSGAFADTPEDRKALLLATRLHHEKQLSKALTALEALQTRVKTERDRYAVQLFLGLVHTDLELPELAVEDYRVLVKAGLATATVFNNLGMLYAGLGKKSDAVRAYRSAIEEDPENAYAYENLAAYYHRERQFDKALPLAHRALELQPNFKEAATLLAILYTQKGDDDGRKKYYGLAVQLGENPQVLRSTLERLRKKLGQK